jgi:hypothetical protein
MRRCAASELVSAEDRDANWRVPETEPTQPRGHHPGLKELAAADTGAGHHQSDAAEDRRQLNQESPPDIAASVERKIAAVGYHLIKAMIIQVREMLTFFETFSIEMRSRECAPAIPVLTHSWT